MFMFELPLAMCWCTSWVSGSVCGMWTVTFCDPLSSLVSCVRRTHVARVVCVCACGCTKAKVIYGEPSLYCSVAACPSAHLPRLAVIADAN